MAVLAPVLERKINTEEVVTERSRNAFTPVDTYTADIRRNSFMSADESHNSRIKSNYEKLINPDSTVSDIIHNEVKPQHVEEPVVEQTPFLVENARADSDLFRVDSMMNSRQAEPEAEQEDREEEENEDLRPSDETFKYKTSATSKVVIDDKISNKEKKVSKFSKRDKIIMAVALVVIAVLFVLVIVNSTVLSNLNQQVSNLQNDLVVAQENYDEILESKEDYFANIEETVAAFAKQNGMSKILGDN